jgi:hypothetical protein
MAKTRQSSIRLPEAEHQLVEAVARVDGLSTNEFTRQALHEAVERRREDPEFMRRLRERMERDRKVLDALAQ